MLDGKRAYICSPLSATTKEVRQQNMEKAKFYLMQIKRLYHCRTFASHAHLLLMLDDEIPEEREAALQIGMILLTLCDVLVVCGPYISAGMAGEIKAAFEKGKEVYWYDGIKYPGELIKIENWREINDEVQIHT